VRATGRGPFAQAIDELVQDLRPADTRLIDSRSPTGRGIRRAPTGANRLLRLLRGSDH